MRKWQLHWLGRFILLGFSLGWIQSAWAEASAIEQFQRFIQTVQSAQGKFEQVSDQKSTGQFAFKRPAQFRWETSEPFEQLILSDGHTLYQYDADLEQLIRRPLTQAVGQSPAMILFGNQDISRSFDLQTLPSSADLAWLKATPKQADAGFQYLELGFKHNLPVEIKIIDVFGKTTLIHLSRMKSNIALKDQRFQFVPPKGTDVIDMQ